MALTNERLIEYVDYDQESGFFTKRSGRNKGIRLGSKTEKGYLAITIDGKAYRAHRLAWMYVYGKMPVNLIDHINNIKDDNRICNLREANLAQNAGNMKLMSTNLLGVKGVSFKAGKFVACIMVSKQNIYLGRHETADEAAHSYNKAAIKYFGDFASLNPVGKDY